MRKVEGNLIPVAVLNSPPVWVKAEIHGPLAIHESIGTEGMTVTHVETGKAALVDVDYGTALSFVERTKGLDWSDPASIREEVKEAARLAKRRQNR